MCCINSLNDGTACVSLACYTASGGPILQSHGGSADKFR